MAKAIHARRLGDDFQAYYFWKRACSMLHTRNEIKRVGFEVNDGYKAFDDVVVEYERGRPWRDGIVNAEYVQLKFSAGYGKFLSFNALLDPAFINAKSISLLQRLRDAVFKMEEQKHSHYFTLLGPWHIELSDPLIELYRRGNGSLDMDCLFDGTGKRGKMGAVRDRLVNHLEIAESELRRILERLRIAFVLEDMMQVREGLCTETVAAGLKPFDMGSMTDIYCQLPWRLNQEGISWFTPEILREIVIREKLLDNQKPITENNRLKLGIRTFMRWAEDMESQTDEMLCLVNYFIGRQICDGSLWSDTVVPNVQAFFKKTVLVDKRIQLDLRASHGSIAFLAGYLIEPKMGVDITLLQRSSTEVWMVEQALLSSFSSKWHIDTIDIGRSGDELAVAIGITHDIGTEVLEYVKNRLPAVKNLDVFTPLDGASSISIQNGTEAFYLAQLLVSHVRKIRQERQIAGLIHLFIAGPNGFTFYLGQFFRSVGVSRFYEYNFENPGMCEYWPSITVVPTITL